MADSNGPILLASRFAGPKNQLLSGNGDLIAKAKALFPDEPEEAIVKGVEKIKAVNPKATDEQVIEIATKTKQQLGAAQPQPSATPIENPDVRNHIEKLYGERYSDSARQKLLDENESDASGPNWSAGLAALGTGLSGGDAVGAGQSILKSQQAKRDSRVSEFDKGRANVVSDYDMGRKMKGDLEEDSLSLREKDPSSPESSLAQELAKKMLPSRSFDGMSAAQINKQLPALQKMYEVEQKKLDRQDARAARSADYNLKRDEKQLVRDEKRKTALNEVEDRRRNIEDNLRLVEEMIEKDGTYEAFGSHNADLDRRIEMIATDMAKLADPGSVARPSEVENFKKGLVSSTATGMRNSTALDILKNFRGELASRADNAYRIRGIENPGTASERGDTQQASDTVRVQAPNGRVKVIPKDQLKAAIEAGGKLVG